MDLAGMFRRRQPGTGAREENYRPLVGENFLLAIGYRSSGHFGIGRSRPVSLGQSEMTQ
jgi:hypothetical protein